MPPPSSTASVKLVFKSRDLVVAHQFRADDYQAYSPRNFRFEKGRNGWDDPWTHRAVAFQLAGVHARTARIVLRGWFVLDGDHVTA